MNVTLKFVPMCQQVQSRLDPIGESSSSNSNGGLMPQSARRLGVLRDCIAAIFDNRISDAKKTFPAVISALKSRQSRVALCEELAARKSGNKTLLEHQQFEMVRI